MTKPRDILKGKVKRILREQEDMGQLCDPAVDNCVSALEAFVHDIGRRLKSQAETSGVPVITPIELKRSVLASPDLAFLHDKVQAIDENDAKYHKPQSTRKRKAEPDATAEAKAKKPLSAKSKRKATTPDSDSTTAPAKETETKAARKPRTAATATATTKVNAAPATTAETPKAVEIEEDDNYDSSDSD